jgi:hypothetical protein
MELPDQQASISPESYSNPDDDVDPSAMANSGAASQ